MEELYERFQIQNTLELLMLTIKRSFPIPAREKISATRIYNAIRNSVPSTILVPSSLTEDLRAATLQAAKNGWLNPLPNLPDFFHLTQKGLDETIDIQVYPLHKPNRRNSRYSSGGDQTSEDNLNSASLPSSNPHSNTTSSTTTTNNNNNNISSLPPKTITFTTEEPKLSFILKKSEIDRNTPNKGLDKQEERVEEKVDKKERKQETKIEKKEATKNIQKTRPKQIEVSSSTLSSTVEDIVSVEYSTSIKDDQVIPDTVINIPDTPKANHELAVDSIYNENFHLCLQQEGWDYNSVEIKRSLNSTFLYYSKSFSLPKFFRLFFAKSLYFDCTVSAFFSPNLNISSNNESVYLLKPKTNLFYNSPIVVKGSDLIIIQRNFDENPNEMLLNDSYNLFSDYQKTLIKSIYDYVLRSEFFTPISCYFKMDSQLSDLEVITSDQTDDKIFDSYNDNSISPFSTLTDCTISSYKLLFLCSFASYIEASKLLDIPLENIISYFNGTNSHPNLHFIQSTSPDYENVTNDGDIGFSYECVKYLLENPSPQNSLTSKSSLDEYKSKFGANERIICLSPSGYFFHSFLDINHASSVLNIPVMGLKLCLSNNVYGEYAGLLWLYSSQQYCIPIDIKYVTAECRGIPISLLISLVKTRSSKKIDLSIPSRNIVGIASFSQEEDFIPGYSKFSTLRDLSIGCLTLDDILLHIYRDIYTSASHIGTYPSLILASCYNVIHNHIGFKWKMFDYYYVDPALNSDNRSRVHPLKLRFFSNLILKKYGSPLYFTSEGEENQTIHQIIPAYLPSIVPNSEIPKGITSEDIEEGFIVHPSVNEFLGLRVRRFFPNFGLSNGTVKAYLPPQKNDCIPLWKIIHDDQDCEDFDFVELLQHHYYLKNEIEKLPEVDTIGYSSPKIGQIGYEEIYELCSQDFEKIEQMITLNNKDPKFNSDWILSLNKIKSKRPPPFNSIDGKYTFASSLCFLISELLLSDQSISSNGLTIHDIFYLIDNNFYPYKGPPSDILVSILALMFSKGVCLFQGNQLIRFERKLVLSQKFLASKKEVSKKRSYQFTADSEDANIPILCSYVDGKDIVVFRNIMEVNKSIGVKPHYIRKICQGSRKSTFKLSFKYFPDHIFYDEYEQERLNSIEQIKKYLNDFDKSQMTHSIRTRESIEISKELPEKSEIRVGEDYQAIIPPLESLKNKEQELRNLSTSKRVHSIPLSQYLLNWVNPSIPSVKNSQNSHILRTLIISILFRPGTMAVINFPPELSDIKTNFLQNVSKRDKKIGSVETPIVNNNNMLDFQYKISHVCVVSTPKIPTITSSTYLNNLKSLENELFTVYNGQELIEVDCKSFILNMEDVLLDLLNSDFSPYFFKSSVEQVISEAPSISNKIINLQTFSERLTSLSDYLVSKRWKFPEVYQYFKFNSVQQRKLFSSLRDNIIRSNHSIQEVINFHYKYHLLNCPRFYCQDAQKLILNCFSLSSSIFDSLETGNAYPSIQVITEVFIPSIANNITSNSYLKNKSSNSQPFIKGISENEILNDLDNETISNNNHNYLAPKSPITY